MLIIAFSLQQPGVAGYGTPWFLATAPVLFLWSGVWLRRSHRAQSWAIVGCVLLFSITVSIVGMTDPDPRGGYRGYSFAQASVHILNPSPKAPTTRPASGAP
jgi:hypothetical protein